MGDVLSFPRPVPTDGGKERIQQRRKRLGLNEPFRGEDSDSLVMLRADEEYIAPPCDCA